MTAETKSHIKSIFALALPIIAENLLQTLLGTADTYFAGKLSDDAIAGISATTMLMNIFISFFTAVSVGTAAVVSRHYGQRDFEDVNRSMIHSIALGCGLGIACGAVCALFCRPILRLSGADENIIRCAMPYYIAVAVPSVVLCLQLILSGCLRAIKDTKTPMYVTGACNILNILLNFTFIKIGMGILGLGLATTLSRALSALLLLLRLKSHDKNVSLYPCPLTQNGFYSILRIGVPAGAEKLIMRIGQLIYGNMIFYIGSSAYVAHNIAATIENYSYIISMGFGLAVCTAVGVAMGENNIPKAKMQTAAAYCISAAFMLLAGIIFFIFAPRFAAIFSDTKQVQKMVVSVLRVIAFFQPFTALVQIMTGALQGAGDTKFPMYATFFGIWGIRIGVGSLLAVYFGLGLTGVWCAYALDVTVRGILLLQRFKSGKWQNIAV